MTVPLSIGRKTDCSCRKELLKWCKRRGVDLIAAEVVTVPSTDE